MFKSKVGDEFLQLAEKSNLFLKLKKKKIFVFDIHLIIMKSVG